MQHLVTWHSCRVFLDWIEIQWIKLWLSIQFCHFNPNTKHHNYFINKLKFHIASCSKTEAKLLFIKNQNSSFICKVESWKEMSLGISMVSSHHKTWPFNFCCPTSFSKNSLIVIWFGLDCQSILKIGFGYGLSITYLLWILIGLTI